MVTKNEFEELKKYWDPKYDGKFIIITKDFPDRLIIVVPYSQNGYGISDIRRRQIIELLPDDRAYYGNNGKSIKGAYTLSYFYKSECIIDNDQYRPYIEFCENEHNCLSALNLSNIVDKGIFELIKELLKNDIPVLGLLQHTNIFKAKSIIKERGIQGNVIKDIYGINTKNLRCFVKRYVNIPLKPYLSSALYKAIQVKDFLSTSMEEACKLLFVIPYLSYDLGPSGHLFNDEFANQARFELRYLLQLKNSGYSPIIYRDYRYMRTRVIGLCGDEVKKRFPLYPSNFDKLAELHNQLIVYMNRESDRIRESNNKELQIKYEKEFYKKAKKLEMSDDKYAIIACKNLIDLVKEGRTLSHCVGSYIQSVGNGKEYILFLRKKNMIDTPFFTIDVTPNKIVRQIHGYGNCNISDDIKPFIQNWATKFNLNISNCSGVYCAIR